jgi:hypothetical protein
MGLKPWLARNTQTPEHYVIPFVMSLSHLIDYLAASLVVFSGEQPATPDLPSKQVAFENSFEMQLLGFKLVSNDPIEALSPDARKMQTERLFPAAYRAATAFLSLYSDNAARKNMRLENAEFFVEGLHIKVARENACQYGFDPEPRKTLEAIQALMPTFLCSRTLNEDSFGVDDGLGKILEHLSLSSDGKTRFAFVVGSQKQKLGCAVHYLKVLNEVNDKITRCAQELGDGSVMLNENTSNTLHDSSYHCCPN